MINQWFFFPKFFIGKIFVARLSETITADDLKEHFEKFGPVTDVYIPKPFRSFAFVTFQESKIAQSLFGKDHLIKGVSVHIGSAQPRMKQGHDQHGGGGGGNSFFPTLFESPEIWAGQNRSPIFWYVVLIEDFWALLGGWLEPYQKLREKTLYLESL